MNKRKQHRDLTAQEKDTLQAYADAVGKGWKKQLSIDWLRAGTSVRLPAGCYYGHLQKLRISLGPAWLASFELTPTLEERAQEAGRMR